MKTRQFLIILALGLMVALVTLTLLSVSTLLKHTLALALLPHPKNPQCPATSSSWLSKLNACVKPAQKQVLCR